MSDDKEEWVRQARARALARVPRQDKETARRVRKVLARARAPKGDAKERILDRAWEAKRQDKADRDRVYRAAHEAVAQREAARSGGRPAEWVEGPLAGARRRELAQRAAGRSATPGAWDGLVTLLEELGTGHYDRGMVQRARVFLDEWRGGRLGAECPTHPGHGLVLVCWRCRGMKGGQKGGQARTPAKLGAVRANAAKARDALRIIRARTKNTP